ncbi:molybdopterin-dependent oxidoreductase [Pseudomonas sp. RC10]|uniref:molybdopterin-dependent oxidoreductase n=1 Tax=Pseudomonas bambusae TaxID=3139142 RepID=UPI003138B8E5
MTRDNKHRAITDSDARQLVSDAEQLLTRKLGDAGRRRFLRQGLTLGGALMLTGCSLDDSEVAEKVLTQISRFNDRVQGWLFNGQLLVPEYAESDITRPFPFNAFYGEDRIPAVRGDDYRLEVRGLVSNKKPWTLAELHNMAQVFQTTRHICVEGWSAIGRWGGVRFSDFLKGVGADTKAQYVSFKCADDYYTSIDMASALHPQTLLALSWDDQVLPPEYGYPIKVRIPTKLGYKNPKHIVSIEITNTFPGGYWEDQGYNWFGGS